MCFVDNQSRDLVVELHRDRKQCTSKIMYKKSQNILQHMDWKEYVCTSVKLHVCNEIVSTNFTFSMVSANNIYHS